MEIEELRKMKKTTFRGTREEFEKVKDQYNDYDVVYDKQPNAGVGYHRITIYKRPQGLTNWEVAYICDGFFYDVFECGGALECWYD